MNYPR
ncbi:89c39353-00ba-4069-819a-94a17d4d0d44 [Thermothielavioides terrestris]